MVQISTFVSFLYLLLRSQDTHIHRISLSVCLPLSCCADRRGHLDECLPLWDMCSDLSLEATRLNIQSAHIVAKPFETKDHNKSPAKSIDVNEDTFHRQPQFNPGKNQMEEELKSLHLCLSDTSFLKGPSRVCNI